MNKHLLLLVSMLILMTVTGCGTSQSELEPKQDADSEQATQDEENNDLDQNADDDTNQENIEQDTSTTNDTENVEVNDTGETPRDRPSSDLKVHYIDVGQADATLLESDSYTILIDAGDWNSNNVVNYLHGQNISTIDIAIGTHPDADHIGQLDKVINQFEVGEVWLSGNTSTSETFERLLAVIDDENVDYDEPRTGDTFDIGSMKVEILHPSSISGNANQESISLKLTYGQTEFIFTGDAETDQEQMMMHTGVDLDADILQLGHHGSNTSTSKAFLEAVSPKVAIYSAGVDNSYGHPHDEVINSVKNYGADLYGTDVHGTIIVTTDGETYDIATRQDGTITPSGEGSSDSETSNEVPKQQEEEPSTDECIDVNQALAEELQAIIHIGPARAEDLINLRPFDSIDNLSKINGIGPARVADIKSEGIACIGG